MQHFHEGNPGKCRSFARALKPIFSSEQNDRSKTRPKHSFASTRKAREVNRHPRHRARKNPIPLQTFISPQQTPTGSSLPGLREDCWICQNLHTPPHLVYYESRTSIAKLNPDQLFQGYTFLALKWHEEELHQLTDKDRKSFLNDMSTVGAALAATLRPDKMNYELLGNIQRHLHWHIIPRYTSDPMWGRPIWAGNRRRKRLATDEYGALVNKIKQQLSIPAKNSRPHASE